MALALSNYRIIICEICFFFKNRGSPVSSIIHKAFEDQSIHSDDSSGITIPTYRLKCSLRQSWQNLCPHLVNTAFLKGNWHI